MKKILLIFILLQTTTIQANEKPFVSWLISPGLKNSAIIEIWPNKSPNKFIWRLVTNGGETLTEMNQPSIPNGYTYNQGQCHIDGVFRWDVIVSVLHSNKPKSEIFHEVWAVLPSEKIFKKIKPKKVSCINESYGI